MYTFEYLFQKFIVLFDFYYHNVLFWHLELISVCLCILTLKMWVGIGTLIQEWYIFSSLNGKPTRTSSKILYSPRIATMILISWHGKQANHSKWCMVLCMKSSQRMSTSACMSSVSFKNSHRIGQQLIKPINILSRPHAPEVQIYVSYLSGDYVSI